MTISTSAIRKSLRAKFGARQYRITKDGEIHVFGSPTGHVLTSWYRYGYVIKSGPPGREDYRLSVTPAKGD